jgi:hypothetical protein
MVQNTPLSNPSFFFFNLSTFDKNSQFLKSTHAWGTSIRATPTFVLENECRIEGKILTRTQMGHTLVLTCASAADFLSGLC